MQISSQKGKVFHSSEVMEKFEEVKKLNRTVHWTHFENELYVYKPLGRKDHREILDNQALSKEDIKDEVLRKCVLLPEDFDPDDNVAGLINILFEKIIDISYLDSIESQTGVMNYYRQDMFNFDSQVTCIINEAFPQFDIEEIENWDIEQTAKYLSRAEWKLVNLRGCVFNEEYFNAMEQGNVPEEEPVEQEQEYQKEAPKETKKQKETLTPEKLRQLKAQFPEIDWENDAVANGGVNAMADTVDTTAPALRPGMF